MKKLGILALLLISNIAAFSDTSSNEGLLTTESLSQTEINSMIKSYEDQISTLKSQNNQVSKKKFSGNNLVLFKNESVVPKEGTRRDVYEFVLGEGNIDFLNGWGVGYIFKTLKIVSDNERSIGSETEIRPGYTWRFDDKGWFNMSGVFFSKTFHQKLKNPNEAARFERGFSETGFGIKPNYGYRITPKTLYRGEFKGMMLDKNRDSSGFDYFEIVQAVEHRFMNRFTLGLEGFLKEGKDINERGDKAADIQELQLRPYLAFNVGKTDLFFKVEAGTAKTKRPNVGKAYEHNQMKPIIAANYPLREDLRLLGEFSWNRISDRKEPNIGKELKDENIYFYMVGLNYMF